MQHTSSPAPNTPPLSHPPPARACAWTTSALARSGMLIYPQNSHRIIHPAVFHQGHRSACQMRHALARQLRPQRHCCPGYRKHGSEIAIPFTGEAGTDKIAISSTASPTEFPTSAPTLSPTTSPTLAPTTPPTTSGCNTERALNSYYRCKGLCVFLRELKGLLSLMATSCVFFEQHAPPAPKSRASSLRRRIRQLGESARPAAITAPLPSAISKARSRALS